MKKGSEKMYHKAKKSLGQNFLKSAQALSTIVRASRLAPTDTVLEVGPGKGVLTKELLKQSKVIAVEKDRELISHLKETFRDHCDSGKLRLIEGDILEMSPQDLNLNNHSFKIVANLPYYITGQFLRQWLSGDIQPSHMTLMLQKEVAKRIVAHDGKESILSISVKAYGTPRYIETVKAKYFSPEPNVDSAIIVIEDISKEFFSAISEEHFFTVVKQGFAHKRKILIGNLSGIYERKRLEQVFSECSLPPTARAEDVSINTWKKLAMSLR